MGLTSVAVCGVVPVVAIVPVVAVVQVAAIVPVAVIVPVLLAGAYRDLRGTTAVQLPSCCACSVRVIMLCG